MQSPFQQNKQNKLFKKNFKDKNKLEFNVASWVHVILNIACVSINLTNFIKKKSFFFIKIYLSNYVQIYPQFLSFEHK